MKLKFFTVVLVNNIGSVAIQYVEADSVKNAKEYAFNKQNDILNKIFNENTYNPSYVFNGILEPVFDI